MKKKHKGVGTRRSEVGLGDSGPLLRGQGSGSGKKLLQAIYSVYS